MQEPLVSWTPDHVSSLGGEALELAESAGLVLDPWQAMVLDAALAQRADGKWAAFEVGVVVPRQNGKGGLLEARELAALFLIGERLTIHSAHMFDTSLEAFRRLLWLIEDTPDLDQQVRRVSRSHGEEGIELKGGQRIRFRTRTKGGGRGFSGDLLILDEAMILQESSHGALLPTLSARPNPQVWYTGSAVDQLVHEHGVVLARVRERGHRGGDESLAYFEWAADMRDADGKPMPVDDASAELLGDRAVWAEANPGLGIRISEDHVANELRSMDTRTFAVERLGWGDWPATRRIAEESVISLDDWNALADPRAEIEASLCLAFDVTPARSSATISAAGYREDGLAYVQTLDRRDGTGWIVERLVELRDGRDPVKIVCDAAGPASSLLKQLEERGVVVETVTAREHADACGLIFDLVDQEAVRHGGTAELQAAIRGAATRPLGDAWAWSRKSSTVDISPLVAATLALWASAAEGDYGFEWGDDLDDEVAA